MKLTHTTIRKKRIHYDSMDYSAENSTLNAARFLSVQMADSASNDIRLKTIMIHRNPRI